ncbi:aromatic compound dioxygenase [Bimuria novae-zelandiae CBS 107.79]|uniref:Aromatic compound dioxygenase n=1 Tax=Bimuria novae-zelandiae CBS 107.79 TaxID=1447943 RepID=A0A6A5VEQ3_9PLEO|nr:aromatic compound dioxygenase [Bimuria novae-zelandiae CBS 107.79]
MLRLAFVFAAAVCVSSHAKRTPEEIVEYHRQVTRNAEALNKCLETPELKELGTRVMAKRQESFRQLRKTRGIELEPRDKEALIKWNAISHGKTAEGKGKDFTDDEKLFGYKKGDKFPASSCILMPENVWGPYFSDREAYRSNIREGQQGIYQRLALQIIDVTTCKPLHGARVDVWHTNAEGVYAKQVRNESNDVHWLTGAQSTLDWGLVDFDTIFPGHYTGRNVHTHVSRSS